MYYGLPDEVPADGDRVMTPFLDVIFSVLFFLMLSVGYAQEPIHVPITAPRSGERHESLGEHPTLTIAADGQLVLDGHIVALDEAVARVSARSEAEQVERPAVLVRCAGELEYDLVFQVREQFLRAGIDFIEQGRVERHREQ